MDEHTKADLSQDLESFRKQWQDEVVHHHQHGNQQSSAVQPRLSPTTRTVPIPPPSTSTPTSPSTQKAILKSPVTSPKSKSKIVPPTSLSGSAQFKHHQPLTSTGTLTPSSEASALDVYALAIDAERSGQLGPAVKLYQRAFRMNDQIDKLYQRTQRELALQHENYPTASSDPLDPPPIVEPTGDNRSNHEAQDPVGSLVFDFKTHFQLGPDYVPAEQAVSSSSASPVYASIADEHPTFVQAEETEPYAWGVLPEEIVIYILTIMMESGDWKTVSAFERVCRKAFLLGREQSVWKKICALTFVPPQIERHISLQALVKPYHFNYRETFINHPRVRMDGLYISVVHYHRQGITENSWYDEVHTVTYHRLIRFYADGTVISLLSTEHPSTLVPLLNRSLRMKGLHHGNWSLTSFEPSHHKNQVHLPGAPRVVLTGLVDPGLMEGRMKKGNKYEFEMDLGLRCTQLGRWNKLDLHTYFSNNLLTGEVIPIGMAVQKPFYFSKVKSWPPFG
ncbi:F-box protein FBX9 [Phaffia rhodozyma]|uniref:F-box protein FBX9 n=1 Tax=Phaffia rhodozyma TaxID=264483 RepID=A0A0F7SMY7_PHARH|nr:F-box protein FBX9 [Phaffia rhodozyma]